MNRPWMKRSGFILPLVMVLMSLSIVAITVIIVRVSAYRRLSVFCARREQAKLLILSAAQIAMSQLAGSPPADTANQYPSGPASPEQQAFEAVMKVTNRWQKIQLTSEHEGVDGTIEFMIVAESGKIPLNTLYDFQKKGYRTEPFDGRQVALSIETLFKTARKPIKFVEGFEVLCKKRGKPFDDVTQLLASPDLVPLATILFPHPTEGGKVEPTVLDLFTLARDAAIIPPLMCETMIKLLDLKPLPRTQSEREALIKNFSATTDWVKEWDTKLAGIYGKKFADLPPVWQKAMYPTYGASTFSVVSYAKVGSVTQKAYIILEKLTSKTKEPVTYVITRLYWF